MRAPEAVTVSALARAQFVWIRHNVVARVFSACHRLAGKLRTLYRRVRCRRSPEFMLSEVQQKLDLNRREREKVGARLQERYAEIVRRKAVYESAPPARRAILEAELRALLAGYKADEREWQVRTENETVLTRAEGSLRELIARAQVGVTEVEIDRLTDEIRQAVDEAQGRMQALRDLDRAARSVEAVVPTDRLVEELAKFDESLSARAATAMSEQASRTPAGAAASLAEEAGSPAPLAKSETAKDAEPL